MKLTDDEKIRATDILSKMIQGTCTDIDFNVYNALYRKDPEYFIMSQLNVVQMHPAFNDGDTVIDNWHKNSLIKIKLEEMKNRGKLQTAQTNKINVSEINRLMNLRDEREGKRFGMLEPRRIVEVDGKVVDVKDAKLEPEFTESSNVGEEKKQ